MTKTNVMDPRPPHRHAPECGLLYPPSVQCSRADTWKRAAAQRETMMRASPSTENSVRPMADLIPPNEPHSSSSLRPCSSLVNQIRRCTPVQGGTVLEIDFKAAG